MLRREPSKGPFALLRCCDPRQRRRPVRAEQLTQMALALVAVILTERGRPALRVDAAHARQPSGVAIRVRRSTDSCGPMPRAAHARGRGRTGGAANRLTTRSSIITQSRLDGHGTVRDYAKVDSAQREVHSTAEPELLCFVISDHGVDAWRNAVEFRGARCGGQQIALVRPGDEEDISVPVLLAAVKDLDLTFSSSPCRKSSITSIQGNGYSSSGTTGAG